MSTSWPWYWSTVDRERLASHSPPRWRLRRSVPCSATCGAAEAALSPYICNYHIYDKLCIILTVKIWPDWKNMGRFVQVFSCFNSNQINTRLPYRQLRVFYKCFKSIVFMQYMLSKLKTRITVSKSIYFLR